LRKCERLSETQCGSEKSERECVRVTDQGESGSAGAKIVK